MRRLLARRWTPGEDAELARMWVDGRPVIRIALTLRKGKSSIYVRAAALSLPRRPSFRRSPPLAPRLARVPRSPDTDAHVDRPDLLSSRPLGHSDDYGESNPR